MDNTLGISNMSPFCHFFLSYFNFSMPHFFSQLYTQKREGREKNALIQQALYPFGIPGSVLTEIFSNVVQKEYSSFNVVSDENFALTRLVPLFKYFLKKQTKTKKLNTYVHRYNINMKIMQHSHNRHPSSLDRFSENIDCKAELQLIFLRLIH